MKIMERMLNENKLFLQPIYVDSQFRIFLKTESLILKDQNALCEAGPKNGKEKQESQLELQNSSISEILFLRDLWQVKIMKYILIGNGIN